MVRPLRHASRVVLRNWRWQRNGIQIRRWLDHGIAESVRHVGGTLLGPHHLSPRCSTTHQFKGRRVCCQKTGMIVPRILNRTANHRTLVLVKLPVDVLRSGQKLDDQIEIKLIDGNSVTGRCASGEGVTQRTFEL